MTTQPQGRVQPGEAEISPPIEFSRPHLPALIAKGEGSAVSLPLDRYDLATSAAEIERVISERIDPNEAIDRAERAVRDCLRQGDPGYAEKALALIEVVGEYPQWIAKRVFKVMRTTPGIYRPAPVFKGLAEAEMEPLRKALHGARRLLNEVHAREKAKVRADGTRADYRAMLARVTLALRARWGGALPSWFDLQLAFDGTLAFKVAKPVMIEQLAVDGDAAALVHLRRGCAWRRAWRGGRGEAAAMALDLGDDETAHDLATATDVGSGAGSDVAYQVGRSRKSDEAMARALSMSACRRRADAEGLA